jgi:cytochrome c peroxidase
MKLKIAALALASAATLYSCTKSISINQQDEVKPNLPATAFKYSEGKMPFGLGQVTSHTLVRPDFMGDGVFDMNNGLSSFNGSAEHVVVTDEGATLGRVLFYDPKLSLNNTVSCGSCHHQDKAFADGLAVSSGFEGRKTTRSSMAFCNTLLNNNLFWDSRSSDLNDLALQPVANHIEMGMEDMSRLVTKLSKTSYYKPLFQKAFGSEEITKEKIGAALSMFVGSIVTNNSKFDRAVAITASTTTTDPNGIVSPGFNANDAELAFNFDALPVDYSVFTALEKTGHDLFSTHCASCHQAPNFAADDRPNGAYGGGSGFNGGENQRGATNIGLDLYDTDAGVPGKGTFRIPSLRNIALTAPYMHDGTFTTLEQVLDHYSGGIKPNPKLDAKFRNGNGSVKQMNLSNTDKQALIAFMNTLTDWDNPRYSDPFKQ